jgi:hypothetical protein
MSQHTMSKPKHLPMTLAALWAEQEALLEAARVSTPYGATQANGLYGNGASLHTCMTCAKCPTPRSGGVPRQQRTP